MTATIRQDCYSSITVEGEKSELVQPIQYRYPADFRESATPSPPPSLFPASVFYPGVRNAPFNQMQSTAGALTVKLCKAPVPTGLGM